MEHNPRTRFPHIRPVYREMLVRLTALGAYWDSRFWNPPTAREALERETTRASVARQPVSQFRGGVDVAFNSEGAWIHATTGENCSVNDAAHLLGVDAAFLSMWTKLYRAACCRASLAQIDRQRRMLQPTCRPTAARLPPSHGCGDAGAFTDERGWWHSDC